VARAHTGTNAVSHDGLITTESLSDESSCRAVCGKLEECGTTECIYIGTEHYNRVSSITSNRTPANEVLDESESRGVG
jgi:hypothetical protein